MKTLAERRAYGRAYYRAHRDHMIATNRAWKAENRARCAATMQAYYRAHPPGDRSAYFKAWCLAHPEKKAASDRAWKVANRARVNALKQEHYLRHKEQWTRRYALRKGTSPLGSYSEAEWLATVALFGGRCAYCGAAKPLTRDHVVPLSRGGTNEIANIVPACAQCNAKKGAKSADEHRRAIGVKRAG